MALTIRTVVRDPVHGDIGLTREELAILDTPQMQRLRGVRQLGTAYLVYPGAQHTRFEHSLGTMHLVQAMVEAINRNRALAPGELIGVADDELRILRAAALVQGAAWRLVLSLALRMRIVTWVPAGACS